jgi:hypothetical protein
MLTTSLEPLTLRTPQDAPRSPGPHLSELVRSVALRTGLLKEDEDREEVEAAMAGDSTNDGFSWRAVYRMLVGCAWEDFLAKRNPQWVYHPGEVETDGVIGTIDLFDPVENAVHEVKATWVRIPGGIWAPEAIEGALGYKVEPSPKDISDRWLWWAQLKGYLTLMQSTVGYLHVLYLNGDYRGSGPLPMVYQREFEERELECNWELLMKERRYLYGE